MTLNKLWRLCNDAASRSSEFKEHYDFAGEVGPHIVLKLLIQREELIGAAEKAAGIYRADSRASMLLRETVTKVNAAWPSEETPVDGGPLSL